MDSLKTFVGRTYKAFAAAISAGIASLVTARPDGITAEEWGTVAGAVVGAFLITYLAPKNKE